ncbi:MAG: hypothetical protein AAFP91_17995 [Pseudomonadota bacterium]
MKTATYTFIGFLLLAGCASSTQTNRGAGPNPGPSYDGVDAGTLIYSVGTVRGFGMRFGFPYGRIETLEGDARDDWDGMIKPSIGGAIYLKVVEPDFEGFETGHVVLRQLPPGHYVISDFEFYGSGPGGSYEWLPEWPFEIEFTISPGEGTYIGSFMRSQTPRGMSDELGAAGYFLVSDRSARDLPIAQRRLSPSYQISQDVTDVDSFGSVVLRSHPLESPD